MSLDGAVGIATSGLANIEYNLSIISQNVANASTPGYAVEQGTQQSEDAGSLVLGVRTGPAIVATDPALQAELYGQTASAAGAQVTDAALAALQPSLGLVGSGTDLSSLLGGVQNAFSSLLNDPSNQTQQGVVVGAAQSLAVGINSLSAAYGQARQSAQTSLQGEVTQLNTALGQIGALSDQIVALQAQGQSTADLQNQRAQAETSIAQLVNARFVSQPNGDVQVLTAGGTELPTRGADPLSIASVTTGPTVSYASGTLPGILLGGTDITAQLSGGRIAANVTLRDHTLPTYQGELDEFSQNLASQFDAQGLTLFSNSQGNVPVSTGPNPQGGYVGFASVIQVNPAVVATPSLVRDGTHAVAGSATSASAFTPNPQGLAGFSTLITRALNFALGTQVQAGVPQSPGLTSGLGPDGTLSAPFGAQASLGDFATSLTASQAADSANAASRSADGKSVQSALQSQLSGKIGVSLDQELSTMVQLQNAYAANAKVIGTVQAMFATLLGMVQA